MEPNENIYEELKELSPWLASIEKSHPFKTPDSYLRESELKLLNLIRAEGALKRKDLPFSVPENYFNTLHSSLLSKLESEQKVKSLWTVKLSKQLMVAASIAAILMAAILIFKIPSANVSANQLSSDTTFFLLETAAGIDEALLVELYQEQVASDKNPDEYLIEAAGIDQEIINSL